MTAKSRPYYGLCFFKCDAQLSTFLETEETLLRVFWIEHFPLLLLVAIHFEQEESPCPIDSELENAGTMFVLSVIVGAERRHMELGRKALQLFGLALCEHMENGATP